MTHSKNIDLISSWSIAFVRSRLAVFTLLALAPLGCTLQSGDDAQADALEHTGEVSEALTPATLEFPLNQGFEVEIKNVNGNKCLDIAGTQSGANAQQYDCHGGVNQRFMIIGTLATAQYTIKGVESGKTLEIANNSTADGANVDVSANSATRFFFEKQSDGSYVIASTKSAKCLDVANASMSNNANVQQSTCTSGTNQRWFITPRATPRRLQAKHSGRCVDVAGAATGNGANVQQYDCTQGSNQLWSIGSTTVVDGVSYFSLKAKHSLKCMDVVNASSANGANVQQYNCQDGDNQKWRIIENPDGYTSIQNKLSNKCLDVAGVATGNNVNIQQYDCNGGDNQRFSWR